MRFGPAATGWLWILAAAGAAWAGASLYDALWREAFACGAIMLGFATAASALPVTLAGRARRLAVGFSLAAAGLFLPLLFDPAALLEAGNLAPALQALGTATAAVLVLLARAGRLSMGAAAGGLRVGMFVAAVGASLWVWSDLSRAPSWWIPGNDLALAGFLGLAVSFRWPTALAARAVPASA